MDKTRFRDLLERHIRAEISIEEMEELFVIIDRLNPLVKEQIIDEVLTNSLKKESIPASRKNELFQNIEREIAESSKETPFKKNYLTLYQKVASVAAILILCLGIYHWVSQRDMSHINDPFLFEAMNNDIIIPSDSLPIVQLANGQQYSLQAQNATILQQIGVEMKRDNQGLVYFRVQSDNNKGDIKQLSFTTPKGHTSKILLEDGTQVWLNSDSKLEYPSKFSSSSRGIVLVGEAYFDVTKDAARPFVVQTQQAVIKVLGTSFNVFAYSDDQVMKTTLVEGKVELTHEGKNLVLAPGEQGLVNSTQNELRKQSVDTDDIISWKEGYYVFNDKTIPEILQTVKRWYNIEEIEYRTHTKEEFTGTIKRSKSLKNLLTTLEKISNQKFEIQGRRVVVMK